jgi:hypothetical protein
MIEYSTTYFQGNWNIANLINFLRWNISDYGDIY